MGICESKGNTQSKKEETQGIVQNESTRNHSINMHSCNLRVNEEHVTSIPFKNFDPNTLERLSKEVCKIVIETQEKKKEGTGFFLSIIIDLELFDCLLTNDHIIDNESINNNKIIYITYEGYKTANIKLDRNKRYIKSFKEKGLDITAVEILDDDNIPTEYFLLPELDIPINNKLIKSEIYIPQYIGEYQKLKNEEGIHTEDAIIEHNEKELKNAEGIINYINNYEFSHLANTQKGSSGSPIFLKNSNRVIGIHKAGIKNKENFGDFILPVINIIKEDIRNKEIMVNI